MYRKSIAACADVHDIFSVIIIKCITAVCVHVPFQPRAVVIVRGCEIYKILIIFQERCRSCIGRLRVAIFLLAHHGVMICTRIAYCHIVIYCRCYVVCNDFTVAHNSVIFVFYNGMPTKLHVTIDQFGCKMLWLHASTLVFSNDCD